jgi:hypothetical protein
MPFQADGIAPLECRRGTGEESDPPRLSFGAFAPTTGVHPPAKTLLRPSMGPGIPALPGAAAPRAQRRVLADTVAV